MERRQDNSYTHRSFNEVLNSTIQRGQDLLNRNFINYDYVESERKDIYPQASNSQRLTSRSRSPPRSGQKYNYVASSGYGLSASKRVDGAGRTVDSRREYNDDTSPLKDYISRKIDTHLDRLRGPPAKEFRTITETPFDHRTDVRGEPIHFESQVQESDQTELARRKLSEERRKELNDEHFNHHRHAPTHHHAHQEHSYDEIHDSKAKHENGDLRENVDFQITENRTQNHKHVRLGDSTIDATNHTYLKHRQMVDRITASHHDSPARESKLFDQTEHDVHHGPELSNTFRNTGSNWPEEGHPQEDQWTKTSRSIDRLEKRQQEIESSRRYRGGHAAEEEIERELFEKTLQDGRKVANNLRFGTSYYGETSQSRVHDTLRLRALEDMSPVQVGAGETSVIIQDCQPYLLNRI